MGVGPEQPDRALVALGDLDLGQDRIRLEIDAHRHLQVLLAQHRDRADIDQGVGALQLAAQALLACSVQRAVDGVAIGPRVIQLHALEHSSDIREGRSRVVGDDPAPGIERPRARVLEIEDAVSEPAKPLEVVQHLPGHAGEGHVPQSTGDD